MTDEIIKERMLRTLKRNLVREWCEDGDTLLKEMYLQNPEGCIYDKFLGDDVLIDIQHKFYNFFSAIRYEFEKFTEIYIIPSYEDATVSIMMLDDKLMYKDYRKAWNFWCESEEELVNAMYEIYLEIRSKYPPKYKTYNCWTLDEEEILHVLDEVYNEGDYTKVPVTDDWLEMIANEFKDRLAIMGEEWESVLKEIVEEDLAGQ